MVFLSFTCPNARADEQNPEPIRSPYDMIKVLSTAIECVRQNFVESSKVDYQELAYGALRGMLTELDPHSQFLDPEAYADMQRDTKSEFAGIGAVVSNTGDTPTIISCNEDGPAAAAGLLPGDEILRVNGTATENSSTGDVLHLLRGQAGEKVVLTIRRPSQGSVKDYTLTRQIIKVASVKDVQILPTLTPKSQRVGYMRITQFSEPTATELGRALDRLESEGAQSLILDLRYNPGGLLNSAIEVCSHFLPDKTKVVSIAGRGTQRTEYSTSSTRPPRDYPLVVLVNYASASASEIAAGALKDLKRAVVLGETTFGKGSVQSIIALPDGSAIRFTTAHYYTPSESIIHEKGVAPDIRVNLPRAAETALLTQHRKNRDTPITQETLDLDPQLARAYDLLRATAK